jgi:quercetin dioxygenase-like cupin family protein
MTSPRHFASQAVDTESIPWIPLAPGLCFKPLRFILKDRGCRILLLRLDPGTLIPRHRHSGEVHGFNLAGRRELIESSEVVGPGGYVYEPAGNVDSWRAVGDEPVIVHITAYGAMETLGEQNEVVQRDTASSLLETYRRYCEENGIAPMDLGEPSDESSTRISRP